MPRPLSVTLVCVLLLLPAAAQGAVLPGQDSLRAGARVDAPATSTPPDFASTTFEIGVFENGSARWTFQFTRPLANDSEREQFRTFADTFESEETELYSNFRARSVALTDTASNATGREMTARSFGRSAEIAPAGNRGIVEISFIWTGFAQVDGDRVRVGDVFEGGFYVGQDQWLVFESGPGLAFDAGQTDPAPDEYSGDSLSTSDTLTYIGERRFTDRRPRVVLAPPDQVTTQAGGADGPDDPGPGGDGSDDGSFPLMLVGIVVLVVGIGAGAAWRSGAFGTRSGGDPDDGGVGAADSPTAPGETAAEAGASAGTAAAEGGSVADPEQTEPAVPDEELLTDEDRVIRMLESNGGRMKQANIVDETGWSKSKVSMLLSDMEDEEEISKLRVGRENIVSLRGHEPDAAGSPFDDDA